MALGTASTALRSHVLTGIVVGLAGTVLFGLAHAVLIVPIWTRLPIGLVFAIPCGTALAWAFDELTDRTRPIRLYHAVLFGAAVWVLLLPMTLLAAWFRLSGLREVLGSLELWIELAVTALISVVAGWLFARRRRAAIALGVALISAVLVMAGPVPVATGRTAVALFASFLPMFVFAGILMYFMTRGSTRSSAESAAASTTHLLPRTPV